MLWLALHLPDLSLEAFCATLPTTAQVRPVALLHEHRVVAVNAAAAAAGVRPGMKRATALALAADLLPAQSEAARDAAALQAVAHVALGFTPQVCLERSLGGTPDVLLEVQPSLRLFGGLARLLQRLDTALALLGHRVQRAAAPTPLGAALLARWRPQAASRAALDGTTPPGVASDDSTAPGAARPACAAAGIQSAAAAPAAVTSLATLAQCLADAPAHLIGPGREHWQALQGMGLHTLGELDALPRAPLARRLGPAVLEALDRALGRVPDPRRPLRLPATFRATLELQQRADTGEQVLAGAGVLLARLLAWARARQVRVAAFTLEMQHEPGRVPLPGTGQGADQPSTLAPPHTALRIELAEPGTDATHLLLLLRERLAKLRLPAPTLDLVLHCHEIAPGAAPSGELFPTRRSQAEGLLRLLERLRARLGDAGVHRVLPLADHRPERAQREVPVLGGGGGGGGAGGADTLAGMDALLPSAFGGSAASTGAGPGAEGAGLVAGAEAALPLTRPAWLLTEPMPLAERDGLPLLRGRPLQLLLGPERIETGWWDESPALRDYFVAADESGALVWIWRSRLPVAPGQGAWFLQGRFA
jgi:protein ImuB